MDKRELISNVVGGLVCLAGLTTAIRFSPGHYHMEAYQRVGSIIDSDGVPEREDWTQVYEKLGVPETRWCGFDLSTEQLSRYADNHKN
jgi:hypothetical protein